MIWAAVNGALEIQLAKTLDGGRSWTVSNAPGSRGACCLAMLALSASHVYLSTLTGAPSLFESKDGGGSWTRLTGLNLSYIETLAADPEDDAVLYAAGLLIENGEQYTNVLRKSIDGGATWFAPTDQFAAGHVDRVAVSRADGRVYVAVRTRADARVSSVFVSTDGGATFSAATSGLETHALTALAPMPSLPCAVYAATSDAGVFKTWSGGGGCP